MSVTHGARRKHFNWSFGEDRLVIVNDDGLRHSFSTDEMLELLSAIRSEFGARWFPLANNVEKMYRGTEVLGLGGLIYRRSPGATLHAQGASYLGVVLEEVGILEWNGIAKGIAWRLSSVPENADELRARLTTRQ